MCEGGQRGPRWQLLPLRRGIIIFSPADNVIKTFVMIYITLCPKDKWQFGKYIWVEICFVNTKSVRPLCCQSRGAELKSVWRDGNSNSVCASLFVCLISCQFLIQSVWPSVLLHCTHWVCVCAPGNCYHMFHVCTHACTGAVMCLQVLLKIIGINLRSNICRRFSERGCSPDLDDVWERDHFRSVKSGLKIGRKVWCVCRWHFSDTLWVQWTRKSENIHWAISLLW